MVSPPKVSAYLIYYLIIIMAKKTEQKSGSETNKETILNTGKKNNLAVVSKFKKAKETVSVNNSTLHAIADNTVAAVITETTSITTNTNTTIANSVISPSKENKINNTS